MFSKRSLIGVTSALGAMLFAASTALAATTTTDYTVTGPGGQAYGTVSITTPGTQGFGNFPNAPACPTAGLTETITISGITAQERIQGQVFAEYVVPVSATNPTGRILIPGTSISFNQVDGGTLTLSMNLPSSNVWQSSEIHISIQAGLFDATGGFPLVTVPVLGAGADFDLFSSGCLVAPPSQLGRGATATIGFWHNKNGQALILSFNGAAGSTQLGNWLATTFPNLYGCLAGQTNTQIAQLFSNDFAVKGAKVDAQVLATALAVYATDTDLVGGTQASKYGFNVNSNGTGALSFNVGTNGAAVGVPNGTTLTILQILQGADAQSQGCILDGKNLSLLGQTNSLFDAINQGGDIG